MGKKLYVGNLPFTASNESLKALFAQCGEVVSANIINGKDNGGRPMTVNEAKPMAPRESRGGMGGGAGRRDGGFRGGNRF